MKTIFLLGISMLSITSFFGQKKYTLEEVLNLPQVTACSEPQITIQRCGYHCETLQILASAKTVEKAALLELAVFPNPANVSTTIEFKNKEKELNFQLVDHSGRILEERYISVLENRLQLDLSAYSNGSYYLIFSNEIESWTKQVIVVH